MKAAREADLVIEAVPEEMESKIEIFTLLDKNLPPHYHSGVEHFFSQHHGNSQRELSRQEVRWMAFLQSVHKMKLLEVVRALETDDDTLATAVEVGKRMGKEVVVIKESPGFITSRINAMIGNEAFYMLQEGIASAADIDEALETRPEPSHGPIRTCRSRRTRYPAEILEYLHKSLGENIAPRRCWLQYVKAGRLGTQVRARRV